MSLLKLMQSNLWKGCAYTQGLRPIIKPYEMPLKNHVLRPLESSSIGQFEKLWSHLSSAGGMLYSAQSSICCITRQWSTMRPLAQTRLPTPFLYLPVCCMNELWYQRADKITEPFCSLIWQETMDNNIYIGKIDLCILTLLVNVHFPWYTTVE